MSKIYQGAVELIGNTPLVEVINLEKEQELKARVLVKLEYLNPAGRIVLQKPCWKTQRRAESCMRVL